MRTTAAFLAALVLALPVAAQTAKPAPAKAPAVPVISDAQKAAYWKAATQQAGAQKQLDAANAAVMQAVQTMTATCGKDSTIEPAANGDPVCVLNPAPVEKK